MNLEATQSSHTHPANANALAKALDLKNLLNYFIIL